MKQKVSHRFMTTLTGLIAAGCLCLGTAVRAQENGDGYAVREDRGRPAIADADESSRVPAHANAEEGPVRLARFSYVQGNVTWRPDDDGEWSTGTVNLPLRQGSQIWVTDGGRAEIQFDDGSLLRLGNNAVVTLQTLYSDSEGEFTEIKLTDGLAALRLKHEHSVFQVDTPLISVKAVGPARLRIGAGDGVEVGVRSGTATIEGSQGKKTLEHGSYLDLENDASPYDPRPLPRDDTWERWNSDRDDRLAAAEIDSREHRLPSNIALVAGDLDAYGDWRNEAQYGWVWCPRTTVVEWRPYHDGHWTWVNPFGWTWVSNEPWGWAPYHYGTWAHLSHGWAWVPGPVTQCWSPAVVHFTECDNRIAWCPLAPAEVRYGSAVTLGLRRGNWSLYYSIGSAAVYYPTNSGYCEPRAFNTTVVNHITYVRNGANNFNGPSAHGRYQNTSEYFAANSNTYLNGRFVPVNSRIASGVTAANAADFGGRGRYEPVGQSAAGLFQRGRIVAAPPIGHAPIAGPLAIKPTIQALTPTRSYLAGTRMPDRILSKPVYRAPLRPSIERTSAPIHTLPMNPVTVRSRGDRGAPQSGRTGASDSLTDPRARTGRTGAADEQNARARGGADGLRTRPADSSATPGARTNKGSDQAAAQERAREARRSVGGGSAPGREDASPARPAPGTSTGGSDPSRPRYEDGRRRDPGTSRTRSDGGSSGGSRSTGDEGRRRDPSVDPARTVPSTPPAEPRRVDPAPGGSRSRAPEPPRNVEPRRDPAPRQPEAPRNTEPRRDPVPRQPDAPRNTEPRRDPTPRQPEPRRDPVPDPPKRDQGTKEKEKQEGPKGDSSSPVTGRGRR